MLKRISIQNFKGIGERVDIELRPVTLLFGPNSAGKSTILHAIHFAHAVLESGNADVGRTRLGGDIDLGGFRQLVHNQSLDNQVVIELKYRPDDADYRETFANLIHVDEEELLDFAVNEIGVELRIGWSTYQNAPVVLKYATSLNGAALVTLESSADGANIRLNTVNTEHPTLVRLHDNDLVDHDFYEAYQSTAPEISCNPGRRMALPRWHANLELHNLDAQDGPTQFLWENLAAYVVTSGVLLIHELERFRYVGPIRRAPPRGYEPPKRLDEARWANGLGAWDEMCTNKSLRKEVSRWLSPEDRLDTGYRIEWFQYRELDEDTFNRIAVEVSNQEFEGHSFTALLGPLKVRGRLVVVDEKKDLQLAPSSLGEGIAQVVPVVAAALADTIRTVSGAEEKTGLVAIEQPELHIHPRMQVVLGDLFLSQCGERQFLIETHSEHLMLRLLRRVRETSEGELPADVPEASVDTVAVYYVEQEEGAVKLTELRISEDGEFLDRWPAGFFGERLRELL